MPCVAQGPTGVREAIHERVSLRKPVPVLLGYLTAIADPDGTARFFRDVYGRDESMLAALNGPVRLILPTRPADIKMGSAAL